MISWYSQRCTIHKFLIGWCRISYLGKTCVKVLVQNLLFGQNLCQSIGAESLIWAELVSKYWCRINWVQNNTLNKTFVLIYDMWTKLPRILVDFASLVRATKHIIVLINTAARGSCNTAARGICNTAARDSCNTATRDSCNTAVRNICNTAARASAKQLQGTAAIQLQGTAAIQLQGTAAIQLLGMRWTSSQACCSAYLALTHQSTQLLLRVSH